MSLNKGLDLKGKTRYKSRKTEEQRDSVFRITVLNPKNPVKTKSP